MNASIVHIAPKKTAIWFTILIAGGILLFTLVHIVKHQGDETSANNTSAAQSSVLKQAAQFDHAGRYSDEAAALHVYLKTNPPKQYRYQPLMMLGDISYNKSDDAAAVAYYKQAEMISGKVQLQDAAGIAVAAQAEGDKVTAIYYYREAIKLSTNQPGIANSVDDYKSAIQYLGGTP